MKKNGCFGALYKFELIKILKNKVAVIAFLIFFVFGFVQGEFEVSGNIEPEILKQYMNLDGRILDGELIEEWVEATDEYGNVPDDGNIAYESLTIWIKDIAGYGIVLDNVTADWLYEERLRIIDEAYTDSYLDEEEIAYWKSQEEILDKPFVWKDSYISFGVQNGISNTIIIMLLVIAVSLSTVFSTETQRKTDPMIRASINGERETYFAKILAGSTFSIVTVLLYLTVFVSYVSIKWGFDGMDALETVIYPFTQMNLTAGQTTLILLVLTVLGSFLLSTVTMFVSCVLRNGMGTMGIIVGGYFGLFALGTSIPMHMKTLSKICCLFPALQISPRLVYEFRLFKIAGHYFRSYQVAGASYVAVALILIIFGYIRYKRYEIKSN
ncbi:MAG: hypothetical protein J5696_01965 [Lachnospiraceae bacterium]|nr:hypothetical protein [Lachnospiraceae bacterium]